VTSTSGSASNERGSATNKGGVTSGSDNNEGLTALDSGRSVADIAFVLVNSERLASDGRLVNLEESIFGNNATVGGDDGTLLNLENIARDDIGSLNFSEVTVTEHSSLKSKSLLQLSDDGAGLEFLDETNAGVEQEQTADDTEINPILETGSQDGSGLHDELDRTDEKHQELEDKVLLLLCMLLAFAVKS